MTLNCEHCGKVFQRPPSLVTGKHHYCSPDCHNKARLTHIYQCEFCHKTFHRPIRLNQLKPRFCSRECMHRVLRAERNPLNCFCNKCGKQFHVTPYQLWRGEGRFCSNGCKSEWQTGIYKDGQPSHYYSTPAWRRIRKSILERDGYRCTKCGLADGHLHVNHRKLRELGGSDDPSNLETLCRRCRATADALVLKNLTGDDKARYRDWTRKQMKKLPIN